jgi:hypothetical protein
MFGAVAEFWRVPAAGPAGEGDRLGFSTGRARGVVWVLRAVGAVVLGGNSVRSGWVREQGG